MILAKISEYRPAPNGHSIFHIQKSCYLFVIAIIYFEQIKSFQIAQIG